MKKDQDRNEALFQLFEKCILYKTVCGNTKPFLDLDLILTDMGEYMASEDQKDLALKFLEFANPKQANVAFTKDKIFQSDSTSTLKAKYARPSMPYQVEKVKIQMSIYGSN